ncbi:MAG: cation:proton antiporter [Chromatiales bacterium]|nr:cation:proton antiporter [Chromatiales bacterium]
MQQDIVFTIFLIFTGAAVLATIALYARQALLVAYIVLGVLLGPSVFGLVNDSDLIGDIAHIGIMFLLFLMGLELDPKEFVLLMRKTTVVTLLSSFVFWGTGAILAALFGYSFLETVLIGAAMIFSSTIIGLKLLPTTVLHHQRTGEIIISILLMQDFIAIVLLLILEGSAEQDSSFLAFFKLALALPLLIAASALFVNKVLLRLLRAFDTFHEYIFLLAIGWCLGMAEGAAALGISHEIGAFVGGVTLASSPISQYMSIHLKPLRDFFLVMFFFSLGASFDLGMLGNILLPAFIFAAITIVGKPPIFKILLKHNGEPKERAAEVGVRLGQLSEFSLLIAVLALERGLIGTEASYLIQLATLLTFFATTYFVVLRYPTPIALSDHLRRD